MKKIKLIGLVLLCISIITLDTVNADFNALQRATRRSQYLLNGSFPTSTELNTNAASTDTYRQSVRNFIEGPNFYDVLMRYHEKIFGVGLPLEYIDELQRTDIDGHEQKFARLRCGSNNSTRFQCFWTGGEFSKSPTQCARSAQEPTSPFWQPNLTAWVCPSVLQSCGSNLSRCFIEYEDESVARNAEIGTSEAFDSRFTIIKSLSKQAAGLATAIAVGNYPYTHILSSSLTAVDSALVHFLHQQHHFNVTNTNMSQQLIEKVETVTLPDTKFHLVKLDNDYSKGGILTTFGYLRRYEKNRTRANQVYERLMCRKLTSELPRVFPQDPGNLQTTQPCSNCHQILDPLAAFFSQWGEGGELYKGASAGAPGAFIGKSGTGVAALSDIIAADDAFAACQVEHVWTWLMGRGFYKEEQDLRDSFTSYFIGTNYSFKELVYAVATHPAFVVASRIDATVTDPLEGPSLGKVPNIGGSKPCTPGISYAAHVAPKITLCSSCHRAGTSRQPLQTEEDWRRLGPTAIGLMGSGQMPPGLTGAPLAGPVFELKEATRCWLEQNP